MIKKYVKFFYSIIFIQIASLTPAYSASIFDTPYKKIADFIGGKAQEKKKTKIAVLTYQSLDNKDTGTGDILSEEIIVELVNGNNVSVVERSQVQKILNELQFNQTGAIDASAAKKIGNGLGADALVIGSFTEVNDTQIKVFTKLVDTETFQVLGANQEIMKQIKASEAVKKKSRSTSGESKIEFGILSGAAIPIDTFSTAYQITAIGQTQTLIKYNIPNVAILTSIPVTLRLNSWYTENFGLGLDVGYTSFKFKDQILNQTVTQTTGQSVQITGVSTSVSRQASNSSADYYQLNTLYLTMNFLMLKIPISESFIPYAAIGYKISLQTLSHTGTNANIFLPVSNEAAGLDFSYNSASSPIARIFNLFTYTVGFNWFIFDNVGLTLEYQLMNFGDTKYLKTATGNFTYNDSYFGAITGSTTHTLDLTVSGYRAHMLHLGLIFKFS